MNTNFPYEEFRSYPPIVEEPVDVVLPWLNPTDKWKSVYKDYCEDENPCRIRDLGTIVPTIRGIEKNLEFVRYIWLIVFDEEQLTGYEEFLNDPKIKIVLHSDIIPPEFLPNFNSLLPAMYCYKIDGLAERFIFFNDDMIVNKPVPRTNYFDNGWSVHQKSMRTVKRYKTPKRNKWDHILETTHELFRKILNGKDYDVSNYHMPFPLRKSLYSYLWYKYGDDLYNSCKDAKIRRNTSISMPELVYWLEEVKEFAKFKNIYDHIKTKFLVLSDHTTEQDVRKASENFDLVCINDSEDLKKNSDTVKAWVTKYFC